eukprot:COSAG02_NODE_133_length_34692_cov_83.845229_9_plen_3037_part_00
MILSVYGTTVHPDRRTLATRAEAHFLRALVLVPVRIVIEAGMSSDSSDDYSADGSADGSASGSEDESEAGAAETPQGKVSSSGERGRAERAAVRLCQSRTELEAAANAIIAKHGLKPDFAGSDGAKLAHADYPVVDDLAALVKEYPGVTILVDAHADTGQRPEPTDEQTVTWLRDLCLRQAQAVKRRLVQRGVRADAVAVKGSGATGRHPVTRDPVEPKLNRRVYISVTGGLPMTRAAGAERCQSRSEFEAEANEIMKNHRLKPQSEGSEEELAQGDYPVVDDLAALVKEHPGVTILVDAHADTGQRPEPTDEQTVTWLRDLCLRQAQAVKRRLVEQGVGEAAVEVKGSGATGSHPITNEPVDASSQGRVYVSVTGGLPHTVADLEPEPEQEPLDLVALKKQYLSSVHLLEDLPDDAIEEVATFMTATTASAGDVIIHQGELGTEMYFVVYGTADVLVGDLQNWPVANIYSGQFFGEMALLGKDKRNAFVRAATDMDLLVLTKLHLDKVLQDTPELGDIMRRSAVSRAQPEVISALLRDVPKSKLKPKRDLQVVVERDVDELLANMNTHALRARLEVADIAYDPDTSDSTMREALRAHYGNVTMTVEDVFEALDIDGSGSLERKELQKGAGMLGAKLGYVLGDAQLAKELESLDEDGDGTVSFEEFVVFWDEVEINVTVDQMDRADLEQELTDAGIAFEDGVETTTMVEAVKAHRKDRPLTVEQTFHFFDNDDSGFLDRHDLAHAAGSLGCYLGAVMTEEELDHQFHLMDPDGDGIVSLDEFKLWWSVAEATNLVQKMDHEDLSDGLSEAGIELRDGASVLAIREALKTHYSGKEHTAKSTFIALDTDESGVLDREELDKAAGVLGAMLGYVMAEEDLDHQFKLMDPDGDGVVTLAEFEIWWKENEASDLVGNMDQDELYEALAEVGIQATDGAGDMTLREALKSSYSGKEHTAETTFAALDLDGSGTLDREELGKAAGMLASTTKLIMNDAELDYQFKMMDPDGDGVITFEEFAEFWKENEIEQLVADMDREEVKEAVEDMGVDVNRPGVVSQLTMREALKAHYSGKVWTAHTAFDRLDRDNSGKLERSEFKQAAGILGASLKFFMTVDEVNRQFNQIDLDNDGFVTFEEFQNWWTGFETDSKVGEMDEADLAIAMQEAGIEAEGASVASMKDALRAHTAAKVMTVRSLFDSIDEDGSGALDRGEMEKAAAILGAQLGFLMSEDQISHQWQLLDPDGDGDVTFDEFQAWWNGVNSDKEVEKLDAEVVTQGLVAAGIHVDTDGAAPETLKQALKTHKRQENLSVRQIFDSLDEDRSGALDWDEIEKAAGILGARTGFVMSIEDLEHQYKVMDPDGDGIVTFDEFETWWKNVEANQKVVMMTDDDIADELRKANVDIHEGAAPETVKEALKAHYRSKDMSLRQVFDTMDDDDSGFLDQDELGQAAAMLATVVGFVMSPDELTAQVEIMDGPDGDGIITFDEFEAWWKNFETDTKVDNLEEADVKDLLEEAGIEVRTGADVAVMKEALRDQLKGKKMSPQEVFEVLDDDGSGFLDKDEIANAAGVLASHLGFVMSADDLDMQFAAMDPDGDGVVTLEEFKEWWCGVTVDVMDAWDVTAALKRAGVVLMAGGVSPVVQREALRVHMSQEKPTPRQVLEQVAYSDTHVSKNEVEIAVGMLGAGAGVLLSTAVVDHAWSILDDGEEDKIPFAKFEHWWAGVDYGELAPTTDGHRQDPTLPSGWVKRELEGKHIYINRVTGERSWEPPSVEGQSEAVQAAAQAVKKEHEEEQRAQLLAEEMETAEQAKAQAERERSRTEAAMKAKTKNAKKELEQAKQRKEAEESRAELQAALEAVQKEAQESIDQAEARAQEAADAAIAAIEAASAAEEAAIAAAIEAAEKRRVAAKEADAEAQRKAEFMAVAAATVAVGETPPVYEESASDPGDTPFSPRGDGISEDAKLKELELELKDVQKYVARTEADGTQEEKAKAAKVLEEATKQVDQRRTALVAIQEAMVTAQQEGKVGSGINMLRVEREESEEATMKYVNAGSARLDSQSGIPVIKYTSGKPPARQQRLLRITEDKDIMWIKKENAKGTVLKPRHGEITRLMHGMALKSRKAADIHADRSWLSFFIVAKPAHEKEQRVYQFSFADEELFTQAFMALHKLLHDFAKDPRQKALVGMSEEMTIIDVQEMMKDYKRLDDAQYELCGLSHFIDWKRLGAAVQTEDHEVDKPKAATPLQEIQLKAKIAKANATVAEAQSQAMYGAASRPVPMTEKQMQTELKEFQKLVDRATETGDREKKADAIADLAAAEARVEQRKMALLAVEEVTVVEQELNAAKLHAEGTVGVDTATIDADADTAVNTDVDAAATSDGGRSADLTPAQESAKQAEEATVAAKWALSAAEAAETEAQEMYEAAGKPYPKTLKKAEKDLEEARAAVKTAKPVQRNLAKVELAQAELRVKARRQAEATRAVAAEEVVVARKATDVVRAEERAVAEAKAKEAERIQKMKEAEVEASKFLASFGPKYENMEMFEVKQELKKRKISIKGSDLELKERLANDLDKQAESSGLLGGLSAVVPISAHDIGIGGVKLKNEKYGDLSKAELKAECEQRGLPTSGGPGASDKMIDRLARDDRQRQRAEMERKTEEVPEGRGGKKLNTAAVHEAVTPFTRRNKDGDNEAEEEDIPLESAAAGKTEEELAREKKEEDLQRVMEAREQRAAEREKREEARERRAIEREKRAEKAEQEAIARAVERNARRQARVVQGGNGTDEESDQEEEQKRKAAQAMIDAPIPELDDPFADIPVEDGGAMRVKKVKKHNNPKTKLNKMKDAAGSAKDAAASAVLPEVAGADGADTEMQGDAASSSSDGEQEEQQDSGDSAAQNTSGESRPKKANAKVGWLGPAKPRFDHNPNQLVGVDGGMRMTALCREPVRSDCYRGADHTGYYLFPGETFEFITMQTDEQGTKRLKIKTRSGKIGWIRAQAGHTRPRYRVVQDRIKVRASHEKHSDKVGRLEKGMVITCEESIQVSLTPFKVAMGSK